MGTKNTDLVANFEATPQVKNNAAELHGVLRTAHGTVELAAGDSDNDDIVMLAPITKRLQCQVYLLALILSVDRVLSMLEFTLLQVQLKMKMFSQQM